MSDPNAKAVQGGPTANPDPVGAGQLVSGDLASSPPPGPRGVTLQPGEGDFRLGDEGVRDRLAGARGEARAARAPR